MVQVHLLDTWLLHCSTDTLPKSYLLLFYLMANNLQTAVACMRSLPCPFGKWSFIQLEAANL